MDRDDDAYLGVTRAARALIAGGGRPSYSVRYRTQADGTLLASVEEIPGLSIQVTGRKGVAKVARGWIALLLDLPDDGFDVVIHRARVRLDRAPKINPED
jgi:hypothetical protein